MAVAAAEGGSSTSIAACSQTPAAAAAAVQQLTRGLVSLSGASSHGSSWGSQIQQPWRNQLHRLTDGTLGHSSSSNVSLHCHPACQKGVES
jgi:hypothetical protein